MIRFLIKGILRDRSRSLFPVIIVALGVSLTVFMFSWVQGAYDEIIQVNARYSTGHLKITTAAYDKESEQLPNDLALVHVDSLLMQIRAAYPDVSWHPRILFSALLDIPDENNETKAQGMVMGMGLDLRTNNEISILNLDQALVRGKLPSAPGQALVSEHLAKKLGVRPGQMVTIISSTMYNGLAVYNFTISGTFHLGLAVLDHGTLIADLGDVQEALEMEDAASEILGFLKSGYYDEHRVAEIKSAFMNNFSQNRDEFRPVLKTLEDQQMLRELLRVGKAAWGIIIGIFLTAMSIVLWNAGLMAGIRRYGEIGIRLAMGEDKGHIYRTMLVEAVIIAIIGSAIGTIIGLALSYYLQYHGLDISQFMKSSSFLMSNVLHARVTTTSYFIGFIPGILATILGTALSGIGIYRRQTAQLFKELEV